MNFLIAFWIMVDTLMLHQNATNNSSLNVSCSGDFETI